MNVHELVDELYRAFADRLAEPLRAHARGLARALKLAPEPGTSWSRVFEHEVTLGAPALIAYALPRASGALVRDAVLAHMLAVIDAFAIDRIEDEQVEASAALLAVLGQLRRERDRAMARLCAGEPPRDLDFAVAETKTVRAIRRERTMLLSGRTVDLDTYEGASIDKQSVGWLASIALARAAGEDDRRCRAVCATLQSVALALQTYDDVVDWEDDLERGGAWAVCLMRGLRPPASVRRAIGNSSQTRLHVLHSGILRTMLERATVHIRAARMRASAFGAMRLAAWAAARESRFQALVAAERRSAGYAVRAHALAPWASEVLA
jgi:hypothetical protein